MEKIRKKPELIQYTKPEPVEVEVLRERVESPATYEDRDTGQTRKVKDKDGVDVDIPVIERVFKPAKVQQVIEKKTVWPVRETSGEVHEFASEADALDFIKGKDANL